MSAKKATIPEIARAAGVSATTVDRVLNGRPNVHPRTVALVRQAMGDLASRYQESEGTRPPTRMAFIVHSGPNPSLNSFADGLIHEAAEMKENIQASVKRVRINDPIGLAHALDEVAEFADAVGAMPIGHPAVKEAAARISATKPFVALLSPLAAGSGWPFVGQDNYAAGRAAGFLMGNFLAPESGRVAVVAGSLAFPAHEERERGFRRVMRDDFPGFELGPTLESDDDDAKTAEIVHMLLDQKDRVVGLYNAGGCTEVVADVLAGDKAARRYRHHRARSDRIYASRLARRHPLGGGPPGHAGKRAPGAGDAPRRGQKERPAHRATPDQGRNHYPGKSSVE